MKVKKAWLLGLLMSGGGLYYGIQTCFIQHAASYLVYPVLLLQYSIIDPIKKWRLGKQTFAEVHDELARMQKEYGRVLAENIYLHAELSYFQNTKELREFKTRFEEQNARIVRVLARTFSDQAHFFLIDAGSQKGVEKDMVVVYKNNLVGRVTDVYPWYSKVCLVTDRLCKVAAYCVDSKARGIHEGANRDDSATLSYVSHLAEVKENELVLSSGEGLVFPEGFALGMVASSSVEGLYNHVTVKPMCDLRNIDYCMVMNRQ